MSSNSKNDPIILGVDTSTSRMTVVVSRAEKILAEHSVIEQHHSKKLLRVIDDLFKQADLHIGDIDAFACTTGPGSFTGVRTSLGTVKGFAFATSRPLIGIPTLYAMVYPCDFKTVAPILPARNGFVYVSLFEKNQNSWIQKIPEQMVAFEALENLIPPQTPFIGYDAQKIFEENQSLLPWLTRFENSKFGAICGKSLAEIAFHKYKNCEFEDVSSLEPLYIQKTAAEGYV